MNQRQLAIFVQRQHQNFTRTDRLFCYVMVVQWLAGIAIALFVSPKIWHLTSNIQVNVWSAIVLGGIVCALPIFAALSSPGTSFSRSSIAIGQAFVSALFIHLTGGRIESHFHIFGSLVLLSLYRDPKVLLTASIAATVDHIVRGSYWPGSIYGTTASDPWKWLEFVGWLIFANTFLLLAIHQSKKEMMELSQKEAQLESSGEKLHDIKAEDDGQISVPTPLIDVPVKNLTNDLEQDIRNLRIVVLDENEISRRVLQQLLTSWGVRNDAAKDIAHLLEKVQTAAQSGDHYNAAVVSLKDAEIPILSQNLKADRKLSQIRFILLQSMDNHEFLNFAREIIFEACLSKPFRASQLMDVLSCIAADKKEQGEQLTFRSNSEPYMELDWVDQNCLRKLQDLSQCMDPTELASLIEEFLTSCKQYLSGMKHASLESRPDYLRMHAQSLKGCSLYLGAIRMSDLCMQIEKLAMMKDMQMAKELIAKLESEFEEVKAYLQQEKESLLRMPAV
ncbi:MAG TPA: response regulator [Acidobacteriota bacterium]|nr:response regulator [Acidobacteriota bacterium]